MATARNTPWRIVHSEASLGWGGQERRVLAELLGFHARGHTVGVLAPQRATVFAKAGEHGFARATLAENRWAFPFAVARAAHWLREFRADVVNTHSSRDGWIVGLAARLARTPLVIRSRHFDVPVPNPALSRQVYATLADHLITTSPKVAADFRTLFRLPEDRVTAIPTGVDVAKFSPAEATAPASSCVGCHARGGGSRFRQARREIVLLQLRRALLW